MDADKEIVVDVARTVLLLLNYRSFLQVVCRPPAIAIALLSCLFFLEIYGAKVHEVPGGTW